MTCIVAIVEKGIVYVGADSLGSNGDKIITRKDTKIFIKKPFIFGFTSSYRMGQLLQYSLVIPSFPKKITHKWMCTKFIDAIRECLHKGGFMKKEDEVEEGGVFIVGTQGKIYVIESNFQVGIDGDYSTVGCGAVYAKGSLFSTKGQSPTVRIRKALEAAEEYSGGVRRPFKILKI